MSKKRRTIYAIAFVELAFAGIWFFLAQMGMDQPDRVTSDFQTTLGQTMGQVMGAFLGFGVLLMFIAAKNDRAALARQAEAEKR
jgi:TRAP-type C4-dicarboxylate transport system permease small subunit